MTHPNQINKKYKQTRRNISASDDTINALKTIGGGIISEGIRIVTSEYCKNHRIKL